jgi:hypothetical protein
MRRTLKRTITAAIFSVGLAAVSLASASPAQAYVNADLSPTEIRRDTTSCPCSYPDTADGTFFENDAGGVAIKVEWRYPGRGLVAKAEWHPYDEILYVYDTENDDDTIYVTLYNATTDTFYGPYQAPGTAAEYEYTRVDLNFDEGDAVVLYFWDGAGETDFLGTSGFGYA